MRVAVLGAGLMGAATARLLARRSDVDLLILDPVGERAERVAVDAGGSSATVGTGDLSLPEALAGSDAVAACIPYRLNIEAMEAALTARVPYADLGGLFHVTLRQLELDARFLDAGVPAVIGIGCCPGISNLLARVAADGLDEVRSIDIVDGAVEAGGGFGIPYSADTILDEFTHPAVVFENGELKEVPAGSGAIRYLFPEPLGEMEAFYTLHSEPATLPDTIDGVQDVRWRLALPPRVADGFRVLVGLGLASEEPVDTSAGPAVPREVLRALVSRLPAPEGPPRDAEVLDVTAAGMLDGRPARFLGRARFAPTRDGIGAGAFGTSIPIAVAARWLAEGRVPPGVHPPERAFDAERFLQDLVAEGIDLEMTIETAEAG